MKRLGVALGGGGLKGLAHIGVLQVLQANNIRPDYISGTSAGSIFAALYASGMTPYEMEQIVLALTPNQYLDYNLVGGLKYLWGLMSRNYSYTPDGLISGKKLEKMIYRLTDGKRLVDAQLPLAIIACDIDSGQKIVFTNQNIELKDENVIIIKDALMSEAVRASISIPVTFEPKNFRGMKLVDGGLKDIVPAMINKTLGAEYVLAINLGTELYNESVEGIPQIMGRTLSILIFETSDTEQDIFGDMLLFPDVPNVGLADLKHAPEIIRAGRKAMRENLAHLEADLKIDGL